MTSLITLTTDFGLDDSSVGQCKGVIVGIAPKAQIIDISHTVPPFDIRAGAWMLRHAVPVFPVAVHVAVVDPGVGTTRRPLVLECGRGDFLIGPDNGLLLLAAEALGGIAGATMLADAKFRRAVVANTFHARDIFCPAAAHLVHGVNVHMLGPAIDPATLVPAVRHAPTVSAQRVITEVAYVNHYGSLALEAPGTCLQNLDAPARVSVQIGATAFETAVVRTFGEVAPGEPLLFIDSYGQLCLAANQSNLAATLGVARTAHPTVTISAMAASGGTNPS